MRRALIVIVAVLGLTLLPVPGATSTAAAAPNDLAAVVIDGVGNGHGRGMSQWGAYGWAVDQSKSWQWILDHYYGGTSNGTVSTSGQIRVRLLALDGADSVGLISHGGGVTWNGFTRSSMQARRNAAGTFDIYGSTSRSCSGSTSLTVPDGPLVKGAQGDAVRQIQQFLTQFGYEPGGVDGDFGNLTEGAVRRFQADRGLAEDGQWRTEEADEARTMIAAGAGGVFTKIGTTTTPRFTTTASSDAAKALGLCQPNGSVVHYRGSIEVSNQAGSTRVVNAVGTEYVPARRGSQGDLGKLGDRRRRQGCQRGSSSSGGRSFVRAPAEPLLVCVHVRLAVVSGLRGRRDAGDRDRHGTVGRGLPHRCGDRGDGRSGAQVAGRKDRLDRVLGIERSPDRRRSVPAGRRRPRRRHVAAIRTTAGRGCSTPTRWRRGTASARSPAQRWSRRSRR